MTGGPAFPATLERDWCLQADGEDPLGVLRERVALPDGVIYLDGNSLGPLPVGVPARLDQVVHEQWQQGLIRSWNTAGWMGLPHRVGDRIAALVGAAPGQILVADSTTVNLHKLLLGALRLTGERQVILTETENFHTDRYAAAGIAELADAELRTVAREALPQALDGSVGVLLLTHVDFRTGEMHDMRAVTARAHAAGVLVLWDLSHSIGAVPVDLDGCAVDLAVGCTYKYLNAGPGAPAFLYVAARHQANIDPPLHGWLGHRQPFAFEAEYAPAPGIGRLLAGSPPVIGIAVLDAALDAFNGVDMTELRNRSVELTDFFLHLVETRCGGQDLGVVTPRAAGARGSQVCLTHPHAYAVVQALIERGVIGDFREPNICRFGIAPLYVSRTEIWDAVEHLRDILEGGAHHHPRYAVRAAVT
ncbi:MAG: kynureninase [Candidatus Dormibacteria bacterium]